MQNDSAVRDGRYSISISTISLYVFIGLTLCVSGCGDEQTILEAVEDVKAPDGVLPQAGPKFCFDQRPAAQFACRTDFSCIEYLPEYEIPIVELQAECENDGGALVKHCAEGDRQVLGACVEDDRLSIAYDDPNQAQTTCEEETYEWVSCPTPEAP